MLKSKKSIILLTSSLFIVVALVVTWWFWPASNEERFRVELDNRFDGDVIIVGAGAAGMTAGYILEQQGIDYTVIEASDTYGGRMKASTDFADFPIDLGAEWIHEDPRVLDDILSASGAKSDVETIVYNPQEIFYWEDDELKDKSWQRFFYSEYKFKDSTWFDFFSTYITPSIEENIVYDRAVSNVDYDGDKVVLETVDSTSFESAETYEADRVIMAVPMSVYQNDYIAFSPELPKKKVEAIDSLVVPDGLKVFIKFEEKFYPDILIIDEFSDDGDNEQIYYDATFGKDTEDNVLGLFTIGEAAKNFAELEDEQEIIDEVLAEIDDMYDGAGTENYLDHIVQNWSGEPFILGSYVTDFGDDPDQVLRDLQSPLDNKVYFAGSALSQNGDYTSTVPGAADSAYYAVRLMLGEE